MSRRRRNTAHQLALRADMEQRLESLAPLSLEHRELLSTDVLSGIIAECVISIQRRSRRMNVWKSTIKTSSAHAAMPISVRCTWQSAVGGARNSYN